ncbi:hypothetical protein KJ855_00890 [Patescibacteria group bacterium]|nr:hypothetical protein [Patescibacteria group bacterium]
MTTSSHQHLPELSRLICHPELEKDDLPPDMGREFKNSPAWKKFIAQSRPTKDLHHQIEEEENENIKEYRREIKSLKGNTALKIIESDDIQIEHKMKLINFATKLIDLLETSQITHYNQKRVANCPLTNQKFEKFYKDRSGQNFENSRNILLPIIYNVQFQYLSPKNQDSFHELKNHIEKYPSIHVNSTET